MIPPGRIRTCQARWFLPKDYLSTTTPQGPIFLPVAVVKWSSFAENKVTIITSDRSEHFFKFNDYVTYQAAS